jgi:succinate-semialdehyde dehydrogenase/glutarate-semialdehyde dehydrogenase
MYEKLGFFINGEWRTGSGKGEDVLNPANESVLAFLPHASQKDLEDALESAQRGFKIWKNTPVQKRAEILKKTADLIEERSEQIARIITLEQGKPLRESQGELLRTVETFRWNAENAIENIEKRSILRQTGLRQSVRVEPVGVSLGLTPWNFPAFLPARKLAPALAAGCSMILKASEETPGTAVSLVRALSDAGLPEGVVNLVFGVPEEISKNYLLLTLFAKSVLRDPSLLASNSQVLLLPDLKDALLSLEDILQPLYVRILISMPHSPRLLPLSFEIQARFVLHQVVSSFTAVSILLL